LLTYGLGLGYDELTTANLMTVLPYACAFVLMYIMSRSSDHFRERGIHITVLALVATTAYALLATLPESAPKGKYGCVCVAVAYVYATYPPSHAWAANDMGNETKRAVGMGLYTAMGSLGSLAGSFFHQSTEAPAFRKGHFLCMSMPIGAGVFALANSMALRYVNSQRDRKYGKPEKGVPVDVSELADANPHFRYII
jgi:predicted MFS family arabinose efflux permease